MAYTPRVPNKMFSCEAEQVVRIRGLYIYYINFQSDGFLKEKLIASFRKVPYDPKNKYVVVVSIS